MKNFKFRLLLACCLITIISCNKSQDLITTNEATINKAAISQILSTSNNQQAQRSMYNLLSPDEKSEIWVQKFTNYLNENNLTAEQKQFIKKVKSITTPQFFSDENYRKSINESELRATSISLFGVDGSFNLLSTLDKSSSREINSAIGGGGDCSCSKKSDWCGTYTVCKSWICTNTSSGCGTFWSYACTGTCQADAPI